MKDLEKLREKIDQYDKEIVKYYEKRMQAVLEVMAFKRSEKLPVFQGNREEQVLKKVVGNLENKGFEEETRLLYREIMRISRKRQSKELFPYNIVLIGFMGTGKSTIGKDLSHMLEMEWVDMDSHIEKTANMTISQIFDKYGENEFRKMETAILKELSEGNGKIISCGGGVPLKKINVEILRKNGKIILLEASPYNIYERLKNDETRPLLKNNMTLEYIEKMLKERENPYKGASDIIIITDGKNTKDISMEIINKLI